VRERPSERWDISICGLKCAKCDIYEASHGNEKLRGEIVEWFRKERNEAIRQDQVTCEGCRGSSEAHWSPDCRMRLCANGRELIYCFQCEDFQCKRVEEFSSDGVFHHKKTIENSKKMKEVGIQKWIAEQKNEGQCLFCP